MAGGLCGLFNGVLIGLVKMPAFIVTLATMLIFRSVAQYYLRTTGSSIFNMTGTLDHYASFYGFGQLKIATVPVVGIVLLVVTVIMVFISTCTKFGKTVYALGSNERAAALAGINVNRTRVAVYVITGILTGLSAFLWLAMNGSVDPATLGKSNEMYAIAAVVIGGISMSGGKGKCSVRRHELYHHRQDHRLPAGGRSDQRYHQGLDFAGGRYHPAGGAHDPFPRKNETYFGGVIT